MSFINIFMILGLSTSLEYHLGTQHPSIKLGINDLFLAFLEHILFSCNDHLTNWEEYFINA